MEVISSNEAVGRETTRKTEKIFVGKVFTVEKLRVEQPNGRLADREIVRHNGGVTILAVDADDQVYFVRQYRKAAETAMLELPAGKLELNEDPLFAAKRELSEETGLFAENWRKLGEVYATPGYCTEKLYLFAATNLSAGAAHPDEGEYVDVIRMPYEEALQRIQNGEFTDAKTVTALLWYDKFYRNPQRRN